MKESLPTVTTVTRQMCFKVGIKKFLILNSLLVRPQGVLRHQNNGNGQSEQEIEGNLVVLMEKEERVKP